MSKRSWASRARRARFNGAATFPSRMSAGLADRRVADVRFNGAATFPSRMCGALGAATATHGCFNGAATFPSRMCEWLGLQSTTAIRFNGAATFPSRMYSHPSPFTEQLKLQWGRDVSVADVGCPRARTRASLEVLQWGRDVSVADVSKEVSRLERRQASFNGAATFPSRMSSFGQVLRSVRAQASMGPRRFRRGCLSNRDALDKPACGASMGPRRFRRGCSKYHVDPLGTSKASMGPRRFRRGCRLVGNSVTGGSSGFNGAATFPSRM